MQKYYLSGFPPAKKAEIEKMLRDAGSEPFEDAKNPGAVCFRSAKSHMELIVFALHGAKLTGPVADDDATNDGD